MEENIGKGKVVKNLSVTRWSARADACNALYASYAGIKNALLYIIQNADDKPICKVEAKAIYNSLNTLEVGIMICLWNPILNRLAYFYYILFYFSSFWNFATLTISYLFISNVIDNQ